MKRAVGTASALMLRIGAAVLMLMAVPWYFLGMVYAFGGRWEEGERLGLADVVLNGPVPALIFGALSLSFWKPIASVVALGLSPLLLIETPVMYGRPSPYGASLLAGAAILHLVRWMLRRRKKTEVVR